MTHATLQQSSISREIGRYHLVAELARGGMGNVYLAATQGPGGFSKLVVLKELKPELSDDETYVSMFLDEARLAARLSHPNIVQTNEVGSEGKRQYMVMEYLDGRSLHRIHKHLGIRFPVGAHLRVISEALMGLHHAHEMREFDGDPLDIVHRDVSPLNVFVTFAGQTKVLDFGIAKHVDSSFETKLGVLKGRVAYMAPEQAKGGKVDRRADVYSTGVMIWEAAAGRRLWPKMGEVEILTALLGTGAPALRSAQPNAPKDLDRICARAMAFNREERYATAADLLEDLETHLARRGDAMPMREVGALVAHGFSDERRRMNAVIDEALTRVRGGPRSGVMPTFQAQVAGTPSSAKLVAGELASLRPLFTPGSSFASPTGVSTFASVSHSAPAMSATVGSLEPLPQFRPWSSKRVAVFASLGGALLLGAIVFGAALRGERSVAQARATVAAPPPLPVHGEQDLVDLSVRVSPPSAQIIIDGASVSTNPLRARYPKDTQMHHIVATADGYEPKSADVSFASDVSIDVSLNRRANAPLHQGVSLPSYPAPPGHPAKHPGSVPQATGAAPPDQVVTPAVIAVPRVEVNPAGGRAPLRPIATSNPYGNP